MTREVSEYVTEGEGRLGWIRVNRSLRGSATNCKEQDGSEDAVTSWWYILV